MWSKLEYVDVWYSVPQPEAAERISSQRWHRDYNDKHLLKVFLYLVDVDESMGPFQFVAGSQPGGPYGDAWGWQPLGQNYPTEEELESRIPASAVQTFTGPAGRSLLQHRGFPPRWVLDDEPARPRDRDVLVARVARRADGAELHVRRGCSTARRARRASLSTSTVQSSSGRTTPRHWPVNVPRDESPSAGSWTWNDDGLVHRDVVVELRESIEQTAASTLTSPSFRRFPGIHAVAT